jgi:parallel beta-helix repeat protein
MQRMQSLFWRVQKAFLIGLFLFSCTIPVVFGASTENLSKALKSGKKEIQFSGKENESVRIPKGVEVVGSSPEKASISGDVVMADGSSLKNVTVSGDMIAITIEKGANVTLQNVTVTGSSGAGIFAPKGGGTLTVINSRIRQNQKGVFLLSGKRLNITSSTISNNREEGLDMHAGTGGSIVGNTFSGNKEGGMEVIINGSGFEISGNTFSGNSSSGIALQSYGGGGGGSKVGTFAVSKNIFSGNGNFGIDCKNPQGTGGAFFSASVKATGNTFAGNKKGPTNAECGIRERSIQNPSVGESTEEEGTEGDSLEEETREEEVMTNLSESIQAKREPLESLQKEVEILQKKTERYLQTAKENKTFRSLWLTDVMSTIEKESILEKRMYLEERVNTCLQVTTYEVSMQLQNGEVLCTEGEKREEQDVLLQIEESLQKPTYQAELVGYWNQVRERFLFRLVW